MDRFIVIDTISYILEDMNLKSNMDRFIGIENLEDWLKKNVFKIQYGQIYRLRRKAMTAAEIKDLKSNMDRFIGLFGNR